METFKNDKFFRVKLYRFFNGSGIMRINRLYYTLPFLQFDDVMCESLKIVGFW